jgi:hypothetical protein
LPKQPDPNHESVFCDEYHDRACNAWIAKAASARAQRNWLPNGASENRKLALPLATGTDEVWQPTTSSILSSARLSSMSIDWF